MRVRHGEEAHQDVRQSGGAEHERHAERDLIDGILEIQPRLEKALTELRGVMPRARIAEEFRDLRLGFRIADDGLAESRAG